jgi:hypothetical protein
MGCQTCDDLLSVYRHSVSLLREAVEQGSGAVGEDSRLASKEATRPSQQCREARAVLLAHWRKDHGNLSQEAT